MRRLLVNDMLSALPDHRTFWNDLQEWFGMDFCGAPYPDLKALAETDARGDLQEGDAHGPATLIVRNATWFPPLDATAPTISLLQDIITEGPQREMQETVVRASQMAIFNSAFTASHYPLAGDACATEGLNRTIIPLPVDFSLFEPGNPMGLQQALSLPDGAVCWIGASQGAAGHVKGFDIFLAIVRANPDIPFVGVFKDAAPEYVPFNMRTYVRLTHEELVRVIGACRVGLCTSRTESQHLAGIEMGACGLPLVVPPVGIYWQRTNGPGICVTDPTSPRAYSEILRGICGPIGTRPNWSVDFKSPERIRDYWRKEFDRPVIKAAWAQLIEEVECSGRS